MPRLRKAGDGRIGDLSPALVDVILTGSSTIDPFLQFEQLDDKIAAAWRLYGAALRAEASRRGVELPAGRQA